MYLVHLHGERDGLQVARHVVLVHVVAVGRGAQGQLQQALCGRGRGGVGQGKSGGVRGSCR